MTIENIEGHDIACRVFVRCSQASATAALRNDVVACGGTVQIELRAPVRLGALGAQIVLRDAIVAELCISDDPRSDAILVTWQLTAGGIFPRFTGHVWARADTATTSWLCLDGEYQRHEATLRTAEPGEFLIGHRIAVASSRTLLDIIAARIEATISARA